MTLPRSRLIALLATLLLLAIAVVTVRLSEAGPKADYVRGSVGTPLAVRDGTVEVTGVKVATGLERFGKIEPTDGLFVLVGLEGAATGQSRLSLQDAKLSTPDGLIYDNFTLTTGISTEPGFGSATDLVFEVDPKRLADLTLELGALEVVSGYQQRVQVHLGITVANADQWRAAGQGQTLEPIDETSWGLP